MLKVFVPDNYENERVYTLSVILKRLLKFEFSVETHAQPELTCIQFPNGNSIQVEDHFFSSHPDGYLKTGYIPDNPVFLKSELTPEEDLPVLWGGRNILITDNSIRIEGDILASAFFFLSRWEESVSEIRDRYGRFPDREAFLIKHNLNMRPLVNEYAEFFSNCCRKLNCSVSKKHEYKIIPTHDVDKFSRLDSRSRMLKAVAGDILKRKSFSLAKATAKCYRGIKNGTCPDPYNTFGSLLGMAEEAGVKASFFFIAGEPGETDVHYSIFDPEVKKTIREILERGHYVGIHPGMDSFLNKKQLSLEIQRMQELGVSVFSGRQHYLRYKLPITWKMWNDMNLKKDYGMSFHENPGFRCGIANAFPAFDIESGTQMDLMLQPTILMDQALLKYSHTVEKFESTVTRLKTVCRQYGGEFVFLWHPENINVPEWTGFREILQSLYH